MIKIIGCSVFKNKLEEILEKNSLKFDVEFINMKNHLDPEKLKEKIREEIIKTENEVDNETNRRNIKKYKKIILLYGLCGNSTVGLSSTLPLAIPKVHDCCSIFLGSSKIFYELFETKLSSEWYTSDYLEEMEKIKEEDPNFTMSYTTLKLEYLINKYGEDNGTYLFETFSAMEKEIIFIKTSNKNDEENIKKLSKQYRSLEIMEGNFQLLHDIVIGKYNEEILYLNSGEKICCTYDINVIAGKRQ